MSVEEVNLVRQWSLFLGGFWRLERKIRTYSSLIVKEGGILNVYHGELTKNEFYKEELVLRYEKVLSH